MPGTEVGRKVTAARQIDTRVWPKCQEGDFWSRDLNLGIRVKRLLEGHSKDKLAQGESVGGGVQRRALRARGGRGARVSGRSCDFEGLARTEGPWRGSQGSGQMDTRHFLSEKLRWEKKARVKVKLCRLL